MYLEKAELHINDYSDEVLELLHEAVECGLFAIGEMAEGYAKDNITAAEPKRVDTGRLKNSITYIVHKKDEVIYIGTNVDYAPYVELGTGIYAADGKGRKTPWTYRNENGEYKTTDGMKPNHFLEKAILDHSEEYRDIMKSAIEGG